MTAMEPFFRRGRAFARVLACLMTAALLAGCSYIKGYPDRNTALFRADGSVTMTSVEDFSQGTYDMDALKDLILSEVNAYNEAHPEAVSLDYYHVRGGEATLVMTYRTAEDAAAFNEQPLYLGSAGQMPAMPDGTEPLFREASPGLPVSGSAAAATASTSSDTAAAAATAPETASTAAPAAEAARVLRPGDLPEGALAIRITEPLDVETEIPVYACSSGVIVKDAFHCGLDAETSENYPAYIIVLDQE